MMREKTAIELRETPQGQADRLREALFAIARQDDLDEIKKIAWAAMRGELHGHETPRAEPIDSSLGPIRPAMWPMQTYNGLRDFMSKKD